MKGGDTHKALDRKYINCAIMGDEMVGKTSISESYSQESFNESYEATVFENYVVPLSISGEQFQISMYDVNAKKNFETVRCFAYQSCEVLILCFSTCDRESFANITDRWVPELKRHAKVTKQKRPVILVGTHADPLAGSDVTAVTADEGFEMAATIGADCYVECSARGHRGLSDVFRHAVFSALKSRKKKGILRRIFRRRISSD